MNEPALRMKIEQLERLVHSYEMQEVNVDEKDQTIKKLVFANKTLREDLQREIDRYTLLESKFKEMLVKFNIKSKEAERSGQTLFTQMTGARMDNYTGFLSDKKAPAEEVHTDDPGNGYQSDDSLNAIARQEARQYRY